MAGLVPVIHDLLSENETWMPGTSPGMTELVAASPGLSAAMSEDREHGLAKCRRGVAGELVASPGDEAIGPHQQAAAVGHLANLDPFAIDIIEVLAQADVRGPERHAELGGDRRGRLDPTSAGDTHD